MLEGPCIFDCRLNFAIPIIYSVPAGELGYRWGDSSRVYPGDTMEVNSLILATITVKCPTDWFHRIV